MICWCDRQAEHFWCADNAYVVSLTYIVCGRAHVSLVLGWTSLWSLDNLDNLGLLVFGSYICFCCCSNMMRDESGCKCHRDSILKNWYNVTLKLGFVPAIDMSGSSQQRTPPLLVLSSPWSEWCLHRRCRKGIGQKNAYMIRGDIFCGRGQVLLK